jgi:hypothetical protein
VADRSARVCVWSSMLVVCGSVLAQAVEGPRHRVTMTGRTDEARMDDDREIETSEVESLSETCEVVRGAV